MGASDVFPDYIVALTLLIAGCFVWLAVILLIVYAITRAPFDAASKDPGTHDDD